MLCPVGELSCDARKSFTMVAGSEVERISKTEIAILNFLPSLHRSLKHYWQFVRTFDNCLNTRLLVSVFYKFTNMQIKVFSQRDSFSQDLNFHHRYHN